MKKEILIPFPGSPTGYSVNIPISQWAEDDRPRAKVLLKGKAALSNAEVLSIIIGSGRHDENSLDISKRILASCGENLHELARYQVGDLTRFKGIGIAKATAIVAAFELGNRKRSQDAMIKEKIAGSRDVYEVFQQELAHAIYEEFHVLMLNRANRIIRKINISEGGISGTVADPKKIFRMALDANSSSIILCHNHPSGNVQPSENDIQLTKKLKEGGLMLDLPVLDHIIIGSEDNYFSFADEGML